MMEIRPTEIKDLPVVMEIYDYARAFMRATGNTTQWIDGYPSEALIRREIEESHSFACIDEQGSSPKMKQKVPRISPCSSMQAKL